MIGYYRKWKLKKLKRLDAWMEKEWASEYPSLWRRNWVDQLFLHLDYIVVSSIFMLLVCTVPISVNKNLSPDFFIMGGLMGATFLFFAASLLGMFTQNDFNNVFTPKVPQTGYFEIKEEVMVVFMNLLSKSFIIIYPLIAVYNVNHIYKENLHFAKNKNLAAYLVSVNDPILESNGTKTFDLLAIAKQIEENLELNEKNKKDVINRIRGFEIPKNDSIFKKIQKDLFYLSKSDMPVIQQYDMNIENTDEMLAYFKNQQIDLDLKYKESLNIQISGILILFFLICFASYLESKYLNLLVPLIIKKFFDYYIVYILLFVLILSIPDQAGLIDNNQDGNTYTDFLNGYYYPFLQSILNLLSILWDWMIYLAFPLFFLISLALIFVKKQLIELSLRPK